ncbi:MAG: alpha amylase C-terminal domain-containing protein, partial [Actinobacteria bacterium]|nr:alpha amylase C-terminal domain-containing protein [Actinomycetota bacterium]MBW3643401.1 alpha amylase C-terminal domain-containing protein [Actinomycetota bacterium]
PRGGPWRELLNTDAERFGGSGTTTMADTTVASDVGLHDFDHSVELTLPPFGVVWLCPEGQ